MVSCPVHRYPPTAPAGTCRNITPAATTTAVLGGAFLICPDAREPNPVTSPFNVAGRFWLSVDNVALIMTSAKRSSMLRSQAILA